MRITRRDAVVVVPLSLILLTTFTGCDRKQDATPSSTAVATPTAPTHPKRNAQPKSGIALPQADQRICTAIAILLDTSGSMNESVPDRNKVKMPKHLLARNALDKILTYTGEWRAKHPDRSVQLGLFTFSDGIKTPLPISEFSLEPARAALNKIPKPSGGTAIGRALEKGFQALYATGCTRKYVVCITDAENTVSPAPDTIARQLFKQTGGEVEIHFVAFDTSPAKFQFLTKVNGYVVGADGAQLDARLSELYERRILAETMPAER